MGFCRGKMRSFDLLVLLLWDLVTVISLLLMKFSFLLSVLEPEGKTTGCREAKWHCGAVSACKYCCQ